MESEKSSSISSWTSRKESNVEEKPKSKRVLIGSAVLTVFCVALLIVWFVTWKVTASGVSESVKFERSTLTPTPSTSTERSTKASGVSESGKPESSTLTPTPSTSTERSTKETTSPKSEPTTSQTHRKNICKTPVCLTLASQMNNFANKSENPCVDFYKYTCGRFTEHVNAISLNTWKTNVVHNIITQYLHMNKNLKTNSLSETILKQLFGLCEKLPSLQEQHIISYRDLLADIKSVGAWPMIDPDFDESQFELTRYLENMAGNLTIRNYGLFTLNIHALVAILNDNDAYILPDGTREKLLEHVKNIIAEKGTKIDIKTIEKDMKDVDEFRQNLSQLGTYYDLKHAEDFEGFVSMNRPLINFEQILRNLVNPKNPEQWEIIKKNVYTSPTKWYLTENGQFHQLIQAIPPRTLANFLILRILQNALNLVKFTPDTKCGDVVIGRMPKAALRIYVRNFFKKENLKLGSELVTRIMFEYVKMFNSSTWLHQETKDSAISKIKKMRSVVGYPDEFEAPGALDKVYEDLFNMSPNDSFYTLLRKIDGFDLKRQMELVTHRPSLSFPTLVQSNAFYLNYYNMFVLSVPIIDEPFFSASLPSIARLAAVGFTIGHEIGHAFDHYGRQFDGDGKRVNWWSKEQEMEYHGREKCLIRQYQGYDAPKYGKGLDGRRVSKENIADLLGITTTWMAYKSLKDVADQPSIIGFEDYSPEKLFFHIVALKSCSTYDTLSLNERLNRVHPVNNFRVNGVFANMEAFSEAFQCPIGSPMNPEEKCTFF